MSHIEKEKLIKADIASIGNKVRHAFNQGYDLGFKDGKKRANPLEQEPFINKPCVSNGVCEHDKQKVLDKLRTEIEGMTPTYHNPDWSITDLVPISEVLKLVDKYKGRK